MLLQTKNRTDVLSGEGFERRAAGAARGLALAVLALASAAGAADLSFPDAVTLLQQRNEALAAARAEVSQREEEAGVAAGLAWPRLDATARYTRIDEPITIDLDPIRQVILKLHPNVPSAVVPPFTLQVQDDTFWKADLRLSWPVYTGGKIDAARDAAGAELRTAQAAQRQTDETLTSELARRYFALRLARRAREVRASVVEGLDQHVQHAACLEEEGMIARAERLHAEVARAETARQLARSERDVELARLALASILSSDEADVEPSTRLFLLASVEPEVEFVQHALEANPILARIAAQRALAAVGSRAERARYVPDVFIFGMHELHPSDLTILEPDWALGVGASLNLFDGFSREHRVAAARAREQRVELTEQRARRDIATLVEKRYRELVTARDLFMTLKHTQGLAEENLRVRTRAFEEGMGTSLDVVDARLALSRVELEQATAAYDFVVALAELLEASGQESRFGEYLARADVEVER
ncbi:MAG TPA: TolC family protein [Thermoanaerobaculaceae bacterium]|nr:TolC family protein [Thermoanaerobaculaceae bacterium]HPS78111.1 TolC family protein [Thermoanaerobaculaceae bacterium]